MRRLLSAFVVGTVLLSTGSALAAEHAGTETASAVKVKKSYKAKKHKPAMTAAAPAQKPF